MREPPLTPPTPRRFTTLLYKLLAVIILAGSVGVAWVLMDYQGFGSTPIHVPDEGLSYTIAPGTSLRAIAADLGQRGVIDKPYLLVLLAYLHGEAHAIKAGEYALTPGLRPDGLLALFASGKVMQHAFTLVEGTTFRQLRAAVAQDAVLLHTLQNVDDQQLMTRLGLPGMAPEGWFYPDTYYFPRGTSDFDFLKRALRAMQKHLESEWNQRAPGLPYQAPYQALIMASIIEKETAVPAERPQIAGVFVRRLLRGMPLQTDPTVIYGLGAGYDGNIRRRDLTADGPYNTYLRVGLPPTPIAQPGSASLHAALHPAAGDSLYFVARGDGSHQFSASLAEHNKAVQKYQLQGRAATPQAAAAKPAPAKSQSRPQAKPKGRAR